MPSGIRVNAFPEQPEEQEQEQEQEENGLDSSGVPLPGASAAFGTTPESSSPLVVVDATVNDAIVSDGRQQETGSAVIEAQRDPAWNGLDVLRLAFIAIVALFVGVFAVLLAVHFGLRPHSSLGSLARVPLVVVAGQALSYLLVLGYMYVLVTRERGRPDFLMALHWNWPRTIAPYLLGGVTLSLALQLLAHVLPMPKNLPIDTFFTTPAEAWALTIFGVTLAPLMEELFFRGFLYPVLARGIGMTAAIFVTAFAFAMLHGSQLRFSWGPVLVIFLVGTVLTMVRAYKNSVAAGLVIHIAYNGSLSFLMFIGTDGFRHLEKLSSQ